LKHNFFEKIALRARIEQTNERKILKIISSSYFLLRELSFKVKINVFGPWILPRFFDIESSCFSRRGIDFMNLEFFFDSIELRIESILD